MDEFPATIKDKIQLCLGMLLAIFLGLVFIGAVVILAGMFLTGQFTTHTHDDPALFFAFVMLWLAFWANRC